jgi:hypothetical protein
MEVLSKELETAHTSVQADLNTAFEQCVLCLYGHPNKKGKARHLDFDHNAPCVRSCWAFYVSVFILLKKKKKEEEKKMSAESNKIADNKLVKNV